jgi:predicted phosphodiesterase
MLYKENKALYRNVEHARKCLRRIEGKNGKASRIKLQDKSLMTPNRSSNPYSLPESDAKEFKFYKLPSKCKNILLLSDVHIPYHDINAVTLALDYGKEKKVDTILLNGDIIDFYQLSRFEKDPNKRSFKGELEAVRDFLDILRKNFPKATIIYKCGNHDVRLQRYLMVKAPELLGIEDFELRSLLKFKEKKVIWVGDKKIMKLKDLHIIHGHEFQQGVISPVNIARGLFLKANAIAIQGHNHQSSENTVNTLDGKMITTWSVGCLCDLHPDYQVLNRWNLGFAHIVVTDDGFEVYNKRITKNLVV